MPSTRVSKHLILAGLTLLAVLDTPAKASRPAGAPSIAAWTPSIRDTWQWQLTGTINTSYRVSVYDIDLFETPKATIAGLQSRGIHVVCYFSGGSAETYRPDYAQFKKAELGRPLAGYPDERWVDTRSPNVRRIMKARLDLAVSKGCDGVEPDNVDSLGNNPGLPLTPGTQLDYTRFLAREAHVRALAVALKNDTSQVAALEPAFDFALNEQCHEYDECGVYVPFTKAGKPVFNAEYAGVYVQNTRGARDRLCAAAKAAELRTLVLPVELNDKFRFSCD